MNDLIYDDSAMVDIKAQYPTAIFEDASDEVHGGRFQVEIPDIPEDEWWEFCVKTGIAIVSLGFQLRFRDPKQKDFYEKVKIWADKYCIGIGKEK